MKINGYFFSLVFILCVANFSLWADDNKNKEIMKLLLSGNKAEVETALSYISIRKPNELLPLLTSAILTGRKTSQREAAIKALKSYPVRNTITQCGEILRNVNSFPIKKDIIEYLSSSMNKQAVPLIINELQSPFFTVRESAIFALKKIGDDRMFPHILNMMEDPNPVFKIYALEAIYYLYDLRFYNHLIRMLKDDNKSIRYYVLKCIEVNKLRDSLSHVRNSALNDNSWEVRIKAIQILESFLDKESMQVLLSCLKDNNREVRYFTAKALNKLQFKASAFFVSTGLYLESDDEIKELLVNTLIAINDAGGYKGLAKVLLKDGNYKMKVIAAYALGRIKNKRSSSLLLEGKNDDSKEVRAEICNSLGYYSDRNILQELLHIISDDQERYVRSAALFSVKRIGLKNAILPLFDRYSIELDPVFKEQIRFVLRTLIKENI